MSQLGSSPNQFHLGVKLLHSSSEISVLTQDSRRRKMAGGESPGGEKRTQAHLPRPAGAAGGGDRRLMLIFIREWWRVETTRDDRVGGTAATAAQVGGKPSGER